jgi:hypothetical protein
MMVAARDAPSARQSSAEAREGRRLAPPSYGLGLVDRSGSQRLQLKPRIGDSRDPLEQEADRLADVVVSGGFAGPVSRAAPGAAQHKCKKCAAEEGLVQRKCSACEEETVRRAPAASGPPGGSADAAARAVSAGGVPLRASERTFFGKGFGRDFSDVRIHSGPGAGAAALAIGARAYTLGTDIAFAPGEYAPEQPAGRRLLAHELAHVAQQGGVGNTIRRAELQIVGAGISGPLTATQRRAAASCPINCAGQVPASATPAQIAAAASVNVGTLHAMPLSFHSSRGPLLPSAAGANGIGASLHFIRNSTAAPAGNPCATCTSWKIIQIIRSNEPADPRGQSFVDNASGATPFYDDVYAGGTGLHAVPLANLPESGNDMRTTRSIYDTPYRPPANLALVAGHDFFWEAESCVTCVKPGNDKVLGCVTYGFRRAWVPTPPVPGAPPPAAGAPPAGAHGPVQPVAPACRASPSAHFTATLRSDTSTSGYQFET